MASMRRRTLFVAGGVFIAAGLTALAGCQRSSSAPGCSSPAGGEGLSAEVCIPAGVFRMGHARLSKPAVEPGIAYMPMPTNDWVPEREVHLRSFYIDKYEVTWGRYRPCVEAGICATGGLVVMPSTKAALTLPEMGDRPAYGIRYEEAAAFCAWLGKRLPTEAEWERAARSVDGRDYPWGNAVPASALLEARTFYHPDPGLPMKYPAPVGTQAQDVSPDGVHDLFGSIREWVADWYDPFYYASAPSFSPPGPDSALFIDRVHEYGEGNIVGAAGGRVVRGDRWSNAGGRAWNVDKLGAPTWFRGQLPRGFGAGFRCSRDGDGPTPSAGTPVYRNLEWRQMPEGGTP